MIERWVLAKLIHRMKKARLIPYQIQRLSLCSRLFLVTSSDQISDSELISNLAGSGFARGKNLALLKSLVEFIERKVVTENGYTTSNGIAAFPIFIRKSKSEKMSRKYSFYEAIERYVWRTWWYNSDIAFEKRDITKVNSDILTEIHKYHKIKNFYSLVPKYSDGEYTSILVIACIETEHGVILGGAARDTYHHAEFKALSEALIHALALSKYTSKVSIPKSDYERRLVFLFENKSIFLSRLDYKGSQIITLPAPIIDQKIVHHYQSICSIHRYLFHLESNLNSDEQVGII